MQFVCLPGLRAVLGGLTNQLKRRIYSTRALLCLQMIVAYVINTELHLHLAWKA